MPRDIENFKRWRLDNKEKLNRQARERRKKNPDKFIVVERKYHAANKDTRNEACREYYSKNKENIIIRAKSWRQNNRDLVIKQKKRWKIKYPEIMKTYRKRWSLKNHDKVMQYVRNRRARVLNAQGTISTEDIIKLLFRQKRKCYWCKIKLGNKYHVDHVWPLAKGGSNGPENIVIACQPCNSRKWAKSPIEFAGVLL